MIELVLPLLIWVIGWLFACGMHYEACETTKEHNSIMHNILLFFTWPHYLGYGISKRGEK